MSLERLNNEVGYVRSNCVLIAAEFNTPDYSRNKSGVSRVFGTAQWSRYKVQSLPLLRAKNVDSNELARLIQEARGGDRRGRGYRRTSLRKPNLLGEWSCSKCGAYKPVEEFQANARNSNKISSYCRECQHKHTLEYERTLRGNAARMARGAKSRAARKGLHCTVSHEDILDMIWAQHGRCYYSDVPMEMMIPNSNWRMSLERIDNSVGYIHGNCVLIAAEFNTSDHSNSAKYEVFGSAQWSKEKVDFVWGTVHSRR